MSAAITWSAGAPGVRERVERWLAGGPEAGATLARGAGRRVARLAEDAGPPLVLKRFAPPRNQALRRRLEHAFRDPAEREWRILRRLHEAGLPVAAPLARGRSREGERLLVLEWIEGGALERLRLATPALRRRRLVQLGELVARLHAAGVSHRDLHVGNVVVTEKGVALLDFQRARRLPRRAASARRARVRDLGALDFSLAHAGFSRADRLRVRRAALRPSDGREEVPRDALVAVGRASARWGRRYYASRTRRVLRAGRRCAPLESDGARGLRLRSFSEQDAARALAAHRAVLSGAGRAGDAVLKCDHRSRITAVATGSGNVVVKEVVKKGPGRRLADLFRGSPARRAWRGGHGLAARGIAAATPLAFVERRRLGVASVSAVILEDLRPALPVCEVEAGAARPAALAPALARLAASLHRRGAVHGDLQAIHVYLLERDAAPRPTLIDLEGVRFPRRLSDRQRIRELAQLNASLSDRQVDAAERCAAFDVYARALPFRRGARAARREVVRQSLLREHRWGGEGCGAVVSGG